MAEQHEEEVQISCSFVTKLPAELRVPAAPIVSSHLRVAVCCWGSQLLLPLLLVEIS